MEAVRAGTSYELVNPRDQHAVGQLDAHEVLDKIAFQAWKNGEPGLFFIDENNRLQPTPNVADMEATNPCGEQPLLPYESCNLGSIADRHALHDRGYVRRLRARVQSGLVQARHGRRGAAVFPRLL